MPISNILILPDGCLENQEFVFQCKDPEDARFYSVSLDKRMQETDVIDKVEAFPNDEAVIIDNITNNKRDFKCRISGGKLNTKIGIRFKVTTQAGEIHSFVCTLSIMQQGILTESEGSKVIIGTLKAGTFILPSKTFTTLPTSRNTIGTQYFCTDAYSTLNPQKTKGIIVVWNGSKWVDTLGSDIANT